jgi:hypothetical protein
MTRWLEDIRRRGVDFDAPRLYVPDEGKALHAAVRKLAGKCGPIERCQIHQNSQGRRSSDRGVSDRGAMQNT